MRDSRIRLKHVATIQSGRQQIWHVYVNGYWARTIVAFVGGK